MTRSILGLVAGFVLGVVTASVVPVRVHVGNGDRSDTNGPITSFSYTSDDAGRYVDR